MESLRPRPISYEGALGNLIHTVLPNGRSLEYTLGGKGFADDGAGRARHNRLAELNGFAFSYDAFGRTVEKRHAETRRTWRYAYNAEDQLVEVTATSRSGFSKTRFTYDALGRRTGKTTGQSETRFVWSGMRLLSESKGEISSTYVYEYNSYAPLARLDSWNAEFFAAQGKAVPAASSDMGDLGGLGRVYYFHCNASGMPEEMTDRAGNIAWRARYMTWGRLAFENVTSHAPVGFEQNLRMQGQYHDRETGLHYNTFRYYDCDTGRFISEDPIGLLGGMNLYQYAPNPLMWIDPWGWARQGKDGNSNCLKPENGYLGGKKHGMKVHPNEAQKRADRDKTPYGHWGSKRDLQHAGERAATLKPGEMKDFPINPDNTSKVFLPNGNGVPVKPDMVRVRNNGDGTFHGFPIDSSTAGPIFNKGI